MKIDFLKTVSIEEAAGTVTDLADSYLASKELNRIKKLPEALGDTVSKTIKSSVDLPAFNRSTVDGYAVKSDDLQGASESIPGILTLKGEVAMGASAEITVDDGTCIYVPTGGMVPEGADAMVMIEETEKLDDETLLVYRQVRFGDYISYKGDDVRNGEVLIEAGKSITAYDIALLAGMGVAELSVKKPPVFSILSTGDEIIDIDEPSGPGMIRDINGYGTAAWIREKGGVVQRQSIIKDDFDALKVSMAKALEHSDAVLLSGGSSMGVRDFTKILIESFKDGKVIHHGLAAKPGKPTIIGSIGGKLIFGLPGHPVAAMIICQQMVGTFIDRWFGRNRSKLMVEAIISENIHGAPGRDLFQMVKLLLTEQGYLARPIYGKSGLISTLAQASGWILVSKDSEGVHAGDRVQVELLQEVRI